MKLVNLTKTVTLIFFVMILSTALFAQEKPAKETKAKVDSCCAHDSSHVCNDECKTEGCAAVKAKESKKVKHTCTDECSKVGCAAAKAKVAKTGDKDCKTKGCESKKCETAKTAKYECPMKCEPASDKEGKCSECGMDLKKV